MKSIEQLTSDQLKNIKLLAFDSDGVLVKKGTELSQTKDGHFSQKANFVDPKVLDRLDQLKKHYEIIINSGRSAWYLSDIYRDVLDEKVTLISEIGAFITGNGYHLPTSPLTLYEQQTIRTIRQKLNQLIGDPRVKGFEPKMFLTTLHCYQSVDLVNQLVADSDPELQFYCWWNEEAYDINPKKFTKSAGLNKLLSIKNITPDQVLTVGNGVNDRDLAGASINISTNPSELQTDDYYVDGEEVGTLIILDRLLQLTHDQN